MRQCKQLNLRTIKAIFKNSISKKTFQYAILVIKMRVQLLTTRGLKVLIHISYSCVFLRN